MNFQKVKMRFEPFRLNKMTVFEIFKLNKYNQYILSKAPTVIGF